MQIFRRKLYIVDILGGPCISKFRDHPVLIRKVMGASKKRFPQSRGKKEKEIPSETLLSNPSASGQNSVIEPKAEKIPLYLLLKGSIFIGAFGADNPLNPCIFMFYSLLGQLWTL